MVGAKYLVLPPTPANWKAALRSLPWCGPTARSSVEKREAGRDDRGDDAVELVLSGDAGAEGERLKDVARVVVEGGDAPSARGRR